MANHFDVVKETAWMHFMMLPEIKFNLKEIIF